MPVHDLKAADLVLGSANKPKRQRKSCVSTRSSRKAQCRTGKQVTSITTIRRRPTLTFGKAEPESTKTKNEWDTIQRCDRPPNSCKALSTAMATHISTFGALASSGWLPGLPWSPEFMAVYRKTMSEKPALCRSVPTG